MEYFRNVIIMRQFVLFVLLLGLQQSSFTCGQITPTFNLAVTSSNNDIQFFYCGSFADGCEFRGSINVTNT